MISPDLERDPFMTVILSLTLNMDILRRTASYNRIWCLKD